MRFIFDPTANIASLDDVRLDMYRYIDYQTAQGVVNQYGNAIALSSEAARNTQYETNESLSRQHGEIRGPSCMLVNATSPMGPRSRMRVEANSTWRMTDVGADIPSGTGNVAATYGALTLMIPYFSMGLQTGAPCGVPTSWRRST